MINIAQKKRFKNVIIQEFQSEWDNRRFDTLTSISSLVPSFFCCSLDHIVAMYTSGISVLGTYLWYVRRVKEKKQDGTGRFFLVPSTTVQRWNAKRNPALICNEWNWTELFGGNETEEATCESLFNSYTLDYGDIMQIKLVLLGSVTAFHMIKPVKCLSYKE